MIETIAIRGESLIKRPVVSMEDGKKIGSVHDVFVDATTMRATGLLLKGDGGEFTLPFGAIRSIGEDAITVESVSSTQSSPSSDPTLRNISDLKGTPIVNGEGTTVGELHDLNLEPTSGTILAIECRSGGVLGIGAHEDWIDVAKIRSLGPKIITVEWTK